MRTKDIEDTQQTVAGLSALARKLGYKDPTQQMANKDGSCVGDFLYFLEDNPGAIQAILEFMADEYGVDTEEESEDDEG